VVVSAEENKAIVRRWIEEGFNQGKLDRIEDVYAPEFVAHDPHDPTPLVGIEGARRLVSLYRDAFPDATFTVEDLIAEDDKVVTRWTVRGTHRGEARGGALRGITPTEQPVEFTAIRIYRLNDGKIVEHWSTPDWLSALQQLGAWSGQGRSKD
jgi:steroid delta-isomerase-like uncharacterized protein